MNKIIFDKPEQLQALKSKKGFSLIFKHSTRCPISKMALNRVETDSDLNNTSLDYYYLDLLKNRELSNAITDMFSVIHQSPQVIVVKDGACVMTASHSGIVASKIIEPLSL